MTTLSIPALPASLELTALRQRLADAQGWENKNRTLVQLARDLPSLPEAFRTEDHRIQGCEARVWLYTDDQNGQLALWVDSDSRVVKGLLALVWSAYAGRSADEVRNFDFAALLQELGLSRFLSSSRVSGLSAIVRAIQRAV